MNGTAVSNKHLAVPRF